MKRFVNNEYALSNVILMTSRSYANYLIPFLLDENSKINILQLVHPNQICDLPDYYLMSSRLISFGARYYIPPKILERIGYGSYNFHPGPTNYPGWAPFLYAIYDGAKKYGVTVHEMSPKIGAGKIISVVDFDIPPDAKPQELVDLTTAHMMDMFVKLSPFFVNHPGYLACADIDWQKSPTRKKDFAAICNIPLEIDEHELKRRIAAFGDSDGEVFPFLMIDGKKYRLAFDSDHPDRYSHWLHGIRFVAD